MVSLAYLVKRRFVAPENRVRFPEIPKKFEWVNGEFFFASEFLKIDKQSELTIDNSQKIIS